MSGEEDELLTLVEAAARVGLTPRALQKAAKSKANPLKVRRLGYYMFVTPANLEAWNKRRKMGRPKKTAS